MEKLIREIFDLKNQKKDLEEKESWYKEEISKVDTQISEKEKLLLNELKASNKQEVDLGDIVATLFSKENVSYTSEKDVLKYLKDNKYNDLITTKTTDALNKNNLKKALKTDETLSKALESMTVKTITEWVVVTDKENHQKMMEHIEENKKEKN